MFGEGRIMDRNKLHAALAAVVENIKTMGPEQFHATIQAREAGELARAFGEIAAFASDYAPGVFVSYSLVDAIHWGLTLQQSFDLDSLQQWAAANDHRFQIAA